MKVIVAGFPKTGTKTMNSALRVLGCHTIYDYPENSYYLYKEWVKVFQQGPKLEDLRRMYEGVDAVMDIPCCLYWEELAEAFPEAKIVLMKREETPWYKSMVKQTEFLNGSWLVWAFQNLTYLGFVRLKYRQGIFAPLGGRSGWPSDKVTPFNEPFLRRLYRQHNLYVKKRAPKDRLLVYKLSDGWKPLCEHLNVEIPEVPFPHKNKGADIFDEYRKSDEIMKSYERQFMILMIFYVALAAFLVYKCCAYFSL